MPTIEFALHLFIFRLIALSFCRCFRMADLKLSTVWKIEDFAEKNALVENGQIQQCAFESKQLLEFHDQSRPGLSWYAKLVTASQNESWAKNGFAGFYLRARFRGALNNAVYVWLKYAASILNGDGAVITAHVISTPVELQCQFCGGMCDSDGDTDAFKLEDLKKAVQQDGSLRIRIDLTLVSIRASLRCRELVSNSLKQPTTSDFTVKVDEETFQLHKSVLAGTSNVLATMLESGLNEAKDGIVVLTDTTPAAFKAFTEAIYFDNWDFLSDIDLTQEVLYLTEKYHVDNLKYFCDVSLAEKINEDNALEILTNSAALSNATRTKAACIDILAEHTEFKESDIWLDFKKRNRGLAWEILEVVSDKLIAANSEITAENAEVIAENAELLAENAELKRKCEENEKKAAKRRRRRNW